MSTGVTERVVVIGLVVLATVCPLSCPGSGLGSLGVGLVQPTGCLLGFGLVCSDVPILEVVLVVLSMTGLAMVSVSVYTPSSACRTVARLAVYVLDLFAGWGFRSY